MSQPLLFKFLLVGLPVGLAISIVIALGLYYTEPGRNQPPSADALRFAAPVSESALEDSVARMSAAIGARSIEAEPDAAARARKFVQSSLGLNNMGYAVTLHPNMIGGVDCPSVTADLPGRGLSSEVVVIAAPYTSAPGSPGAGSPGSGIAALLGIARAMTGSEQQRSVRFVAYAAASTDPRQRNLSQAVRVNENEAIIAVLDLDTIAFPKRPSGVWEADVPMKLYASDPRVAEEIAGRYSRGTGLRFTIEPVANEGMPRLTVVADAAGSPAGTAHDVADAYDSARFTQAVMKLHVLAERLANPGSL